MPSPHFPRHFSVLLLVTLACAFAGNHIAARLAFDDGAGLLLAILCRSGITLLVLAGLVLWRREWQPLSRSLLGWQVLAGCLVGIQSLCIYSAVTRIPVGLALLVVNLSPVFLALFTALLGGPAPGYRAGLLMAGIFCGLLIALDVPGLFSSDVPLDQRWLEGVLCSLLAAVVFAAAMWVSNNRLASMAGTVRSMLTMGTVFGCAALAGTLNAIPGGLALPGSMAGWGALTVLVLLYGTAFSALFICMPRLDIARNAPVMNAEPVAGLLLGWLILGQTLNGLQILGGAIVLAGIVLLAMRKV